MKKNLFFILFILFNIKFSKSQDNCIYNNTVFGGIYNLTKILRPANSPYSQAFTNNIGGTSTISFNFCKVPISLCGNERACIDSSKAGSLAVNEIVSYASNQLNIGYVTEKLGITDCLAGGNYRHTNFYLKCDPSTDFKVIQVQENPICTYNTYISSKVICRECLYNCSNHGICNVYTGDCLCDSQTEGLGCESSKLFISSSDSAPEETGGLINIYGYFGNITNNAQILIGDKLCKNPISGPPNVWNTLQCTIEAGSGVKNITFQDNNGLSTLGINLFKYTPKVYQCLNNCTKISQGKCDSSTGVCECFQGYSGLDCSAQLNSNNNTETSVTNNGSSIISNQNVTYSINIYSLVEYDINGIIINEYILYNNWNYTTTITNSTTTPTPTATTTPSITKSPLSNKQITNYNQFISDRNCTIRYTIEEIKDQPVRYSFAGVDFRVDPHSIKITVSISNYKYQSGLNFLQLRILSDVNGNQTQFDSCGNTIRNETEIGTNGITTDELSSNIITISKDSKIFYGRFLKNMLSDNRISYLSTSLIYKNSTSLMVGLNMPHCIHECLIDPDFSVLVSPPPIDNGDECESTSSRKWFLYVVIIVPVVGSALIVILASIIFKRYRTNLKIAAAALKPAKLNKI
ncbi:hypothetical protein DDB_G0268180 [Dictyostelium discoideum AX4]|uniref:EGF-like domain-containing protein n=1 Tax=Dictyostelium discoideum TaxID=44689 RepID=Q55FB4_DICDI|nr:hypothetical protein DDB_G0268180 [Dictyostelium discoideum AX4]EAL73543.1 hypothetical protein DDB_G0268180 [Dictyostelium discoideum AX4]|eukprot:XP_647619.1 hypothetical protein DDB_G0268180 [Dictyostelium discoideum AX4]